MIDWAHVAGLRDDIGVEAFYEVIAIFLEDVEAELAALPDVTDPARLEAALHLLKGSALNLGFAAFANLCAKGEKDAAAGQARQADIARIPKFYEASKTEFIRGLKQKLAL